MLGATVAFWIARCMKGAALGLVGAGGRLRPRAGDGDEAENSDEQFVRWFVLRLFTNPLFDPLSYAAGIGKTDFTPYALATLLGNLPSTTIFYAFSREAIALGPLVLWLTTTTFLLVIWLIADWFFKSQLS